MPTKNWLETARLITLEDPEEKALSIVSALPNPRLRRLALARAATMTTFSDSEFLDLMQMAPARTLAKLYPEAKSRGYCLTLRDINQLTLAGYEEEDHPPVRGIIRPRSRSGPAPELDEGLLKILSAAPVGSADPEGMVELKGGEVLRAVDEAGPDFKKGLQANINELVQKIKGGSGVDTITTTEKLPNNYVLGPHDGSGVSVSVSGVSAPPLTPTRTMADLVRSTKLDAEELRKVKESLIQAYPTLHNGRYVVGFGNLELTPFAYSSDSVDQMAFYQVTGWATNRPIWPRGMLIVRGRSSAISVATSQIGLEYFLPIGPMTFDGSTTLVWPDIIMFPFECDARASVLIIPPEVWDKWNQSQQGFINAMTDELPNLDWLCFLPDDPQPSEEAGAGVCNIDCERLTKAVEVAERLSVLTPADLEAIRFYIQHLDAFKELIKAKDDVQQKFDAQEALYHLPPPPAVDEGAVPPYDPVGAAGDRDLDKLKAALKDRFNVR